MSENKKVIDQGGAYRFEPDFTTCDLPPGVYYPDYDPNGNFILTESANFPDNDNSDIAVETDTPFDEIIVEENIPSWEELKEKRTSGKFADSSVDAEDTNPQEDTSELRTDEIDADWVNDGYFELEEYNPQLYDADANIDQFLQSKKYYEENGIDYRRSLLFYGEPGCLGKGTEVLMYDGSKKKVENVEVGDKLMGPDSTPREVKELRRGKEQMYWVHQNKGDDYRVNESHILSLKRRHARYSRKMEYRNDAKKIGDRDTVMNIKVSDYLNQAEGMKKRYKGWRPKNGVVFEECEELDIDPYFLGLWLGDGHKDSATVTSEDQEVVDYIRSYADDLNMEVSIQHSNSYRIKNVVGEGDGKENRLMKKMRKYNVLNNKHIPEAFLTNTRENRLKLLAGIIDSDGYLEKSNSYEVTQKRKNLAQEIQYLALSLGLRASLNEKVVDNSTYYRIIISGDLTQVPVRIERKKATEKPSHTFDTTGIELEKDCVDDYYGFVLDKDHLFMLGDFTVTHNTGKSQFVSNKSYELVRKLNAVVIRLETHSHVEVFASDGMREIADGIPNRFKVVVFEELSEVTQHDQIRQHVVNILDSSQLRDNVLFMATTNEPEKLPKNFVDRPGRLDFLHGVHSKDNDPAYIPKFYEHLIGEEYPVDNEEWTKKVAEELTPAYVKGLFITAKERNETLEKTYERIKKRRELVKNNFSETSIGF
jgi:SpoVK/Ycf46/Vps4 family AAA+-type ATPase